MKRYSCFLIIWALAYWLPLQTGDWYYVHYDVYQASIALVLLFASQTILKPFWWRKELGIVLTLQMLLNCGDAIYDWPYLRYNLILDTLNFLELAIIILLGGGTFVAARMKKHEPDAVPSDSDNRVDKVEARISRPHA